MRKALFSLTFLLLATSTFGQTTGFPPFGSFDAAHFDTVNRQNLNANFAIPVISTPGRVTPFRLSLVYDTLIWQQQTSANGTTTSWTPVTDHSGNPIWGWKAVFPIGDVLFSHTVTSFIKKCSIDYYDYVTTETYSNYVYRHPNGTTYPFGVYWRQKTDNCTGSVTTTSALTGYSGPSGYYIDITSQDFPVVKNPSGDLVTTTTEDTNGNLISSVVVSSTETDWKDTAGLTAARVIQNGSNTEYHYSDASGTDRYFTLKRQLYSIKTAFACSGVADYNTSGTMSQVNLPYEFDLPNGQKYSLSYEPTPNSAGFYTGRLTQITLPAGGTIQYTYPTAPNNGINCADGTAISLTRTLNDGSHTSPWQYVRNLAALTTTVTTPQLNDTPSASDTVYTFNAGGQEISRHVYPNSPGTGTPLRTINTTWATNATPATQVTILDDGSTQSETDTTFDSNGILQSTAQYDFGAGSHGGLIRTNTFSYQTSTAYTSKNMLNLVTKNLINDGSGATKFRLDINYDEAGYVNASCITGAAQHDDAGVGCSSTTRGLPTSFIGYANASAPSGSLTQHLAYDSLGNPISVTDAGGKTSSISYTDNYSDGVSRSSYAFPTTITFPVTGGVNHIGQAKYYFYGGAPSQTTDQNGRSTSYSYDFLFRPTQLNFPDGGQTTLTYTDTGNVSVEVKSKIDATRWTDNFSYFDGFGRNARAMSANGESNPWDQIDTCYDLLGRASFASYPYQGSGIGTPKVCSGTGDSFAYDVLGRTTQITHADSTSVLFSFSRRAVQVQDEGNGIRRVQRISQVDGAGHLSSVCEVTSQTQQGITNTPAACGLDLAGTGLLTSYGYDVLGNLTTVSQGGLNQRSFPYDSLSRLTGSTTPEAGATSYVYDSDTSCAAPNSFPGDLVKRLDARGVRTCLQYDALHRLTQKNYSDGTPAAAYNYDQSSAYGVTLANTIGRESSESTASPNPTAQVFSYDPMGRVLQNNQCTPYNCFTMTTWSPTYSYDFAGDILSSTNGSGTTLSYAYNIAPRLTTMTSSLNDANHPPTLLSALHYNAAAKPTSATMGNGLGETRSYDARFRLNSMTYGTVYSLAIPTAGGYAPNGNVLVANDSVNGNWTYGYDDLNRLASANATGQAYSYDYDRFSNRWHQNGPHLSSLGFDANNHIVTGSGVTYDAAGNVTNDGTTTYTYDAENRIASATNSARGLTCYIYDASGQRVRKTYSTLGTCAAPTSSTPNDYIYDLAGHISYVAGSRSELYAGNRHLATYTFGSTYFVHSDWLGTERARSSVSGASYETSSGLPFGDWLNNAGGSDTSPIHFTGDQHDFESNLDHTLFRQYAPAMGRWMTPDPAGLAAVDPSNPQSWNPYAYVLNNPLALVDPSGLCGGGPGAKGGPCTPFSYVDANGCVASVTYSQGTGSDGNIYDMPIINTNCISGGASFCPPGWHSVSLDFGELGCTPGHQLGDNAKEPRERGNSGWARTFSKSFFTFAGGPGNLPTCAGQTLRIMATELVGGAEAGVPAGEAALKAAGMQQAARAAQYAAGRPNSLGGIGLVCPRCSSVFRSMMFESEVLGFAAEAIVPVETSVAAVKSTIEVSKQAREGGCAAALPIF